MSCPKDTNLKVLDENGNWIAPIVKRISKCRGRKSFYPSFAPVIYSLSSTASVAGYYTVVTIQGANFFPPCNGETYVDFGLFTKLPITFYNSSTISFIVPLNAVAGVYNVRVVNIYNGNFSLPVNQSYPGIPNYSNSIPYIISNRPYIVSGTYTITSDTSFNTIITFTGNGSFSFLPYYTSIPITSIPINYTVVGGGGGGGGNNGAVGFGGGGGGQVLKGNLNSSFNILYSVTVGSGGAGGTSNSSIAQNGLNSSIISSLTTIIALGGIAAPQSGSNNGNGGNSGAGGTGGIFYNGDPPAPLTINGVNGGGGAAGSGQQALAGNGGYNIIDSNYGGGGGGGSNNGFISGGLGVGGGGNGGNQFTSGANATANTGGGGGGCAFDAVKGGNGGSGIVILYFNV